MCGFVELVETEAQDAASDRRSDEEFVERVVFARGTVVNLPCIDALAWSLGGISCNNGEFDLDGTSDPALIVDPFGRITAINRNVEGALGHTRDDLLGAQIDTVLLADKLVPQRSAEDAVPPLSTPGIRFIGASRGVQVIHRNGQRLAAELVLSPFASGSTIIVVRPTVCERVTLREEDMAEIVHDLKSPLSTIALEAHLLGDRLASPNQVGRIERNVAYMDRLVHELLDLCSLDNGHFSIERRPTELRELIERVLDRVLSSADRDRVYFDASAGVIVACDENRIERVLANFVENALKYAPSRSAIIVRLSITATHACVSVIDSGPGIPDEETATLFDKYRRASTARGHNGSGLGLYVSRKIIEAHGGRVGVESVRNVGSRFFFELPVSMRAGAAVEAASRKQVHRPYVLVVDDEVDQAAGLSEILRDQGYETALATSASEAIDSVRTRRPHKLIVDARLRGTDGIDLLFLLREEHPPIPSLILTGLPVEEPRIQSAIRTLGCSYLSKPVDVYRLLALLVQLR
jgi:signal transduction histidine kinase/CheY-like chemotaxis protein